MYDFLGLGVGDGDNITGVSTKVIILMMIYYLI
jgi:hypothetical protein